MAEFEGKLNLNVETSEIEVEGKFKLTEDELDTVAGGKANYAYCICSHFNPSDGNPNNKTYHNCTYGISSQLYSCPCPGNPSGGRGFAS